MPTVPRATLVNAKRNMDVMNSGQEAGTLPDVQFEYDGTNAINVVADGKPFKIETHFMLVNAFVNEDNKVSFIASVPSTEWTDHKTVSGPLTARAGVITHLCNAVGFDGGVYDAAAKHLPDMVQHCSKKLSKSHNFKALVPDSKSAKKGKGLADSDRIAKALKADASAASTGGRPIMVNKQLVKIWTNNNEDSPSHGETSVQLHVSLPTFAPSDTAEQSPEMAECMSHLHRQSLLFEYATTNECKPRNVPMSVVGGGPVPFWEVLGGSHVASDAPYASQRANRHQFVAKFELAVPKLSLQICADSKGRLVQSVFLNKLHLLCRVHNDAGAETAALSPGQQALLNKCVFESPVDDGEGGKRSADQADMGGGGAASAEDVSKRAKVDAAEENAVACSVAPSIVATGKPKF